MTWYNDSNTLSGLLRSLGRNGLLPAQQNLFTTLDLMEMLSEETLNRVVPFITSLNEGYFLKSVWYPVQASSSRLLSTAPSNGVSETVAAPQYPFPPDSVGRRLHDIAVFWGGGRQDSLVQVTDYQVGKMGQYGRGVYIEGDHFTLFPATNFTNASHMRLSYRGRPLPLCDDSGTRTDGPTGAQVVSLTLTASTSSTPAYYQATFASSATTISTWTAPYPVNIIDGAPGFATQVTVSTLSVASPVAGSLYFLSTDVTDPYGKLLIAPTYWVADAGYSPVLQMPTEAAQMAVYAVLSKALKAMNNEQWQTHEKTFTDLLEASKFLFAPRVDDSPKILSPARRGRGGGGWY